jgi:hypothetical protein
MIRLARIITTLMIGALLCAPVSAAKFYRWTDENGVTHYTQTPPPEGTQSREIRTFGPSSDQEAELERLQEQRQQAEAARQQQMKRQAEAAKEKSAPDQATQERCEQHRKNLEELRNRPVLRTTDPDTGEVIALDDDGRQKLIAETLEALKLCE